MAEMSDPERRAHINAIEGGLDLYAVVRIHSIDSFGQGHLDGFQFDRCGNALQF
jgi:hypothetical protein